MIETTGQAERLPRMATTKERNMETRFCFVYGSLMTGFSNHRRLGGARLIGTRKLGGFRMLDLGAFPGIVPGGFELVLGELYEVNADQLADLDRLEGHPTFYRRTLVTLTDGTEAWTYVLVDLDRYKRARAVRGNDWRAANTFEFEVEIEDDLGILDDDRSREPYSRVQLTFDLE